MVIPSSVLMFLVQILDSRMVNRLRLMGKSSGSITCPARKRLLVAAGLGGRSI